MADLSEWSLAAFRLFVFIYPLVVLIWGLAALDDTHYPEFYE